jgi:hypothetical protein
MRITFNPALPEGANPRRAQDMKKTFAAFVAVATIAASLAATPASAQRGVGAALPHGARALLGWLRLALPSLRGLQLI